MSDTVRGRVGLDIDGDQVDEEEEEEEGHFLDEARGGADGDLQRFV